MHKFLHDMIHKGLHLFVRRVEYEVRSREYTKHDNKEMGTDVTKRGEASGGAYNPVDKSIIETAANLMEQKKKKL